MISRIFGENNQDYCEIQMIVRNNKDNVFYINSLILNLQFDERSQHSEIQHHFELLEIFKIVY